MKLFHSWSVLFQVLPLRLLAFLYLNQTTHHSLAPLVHLGIFSCEVSFFSTFRCWIGQHYDIYRLVFHYLWIFIIVIMMVVVYSFIGYRIYRIHQQSRVSSEIWSKQLKKLAGYPIGFFCVFVPIGNRKNMCNYANIL